MNIFSDDRFLDTFGQVYFPRQTVTAEIFELDGQLWKLPARNGKPITGAQFIDFFEPILDAPSAASVRARPVRYLLRTSQAIVPCSEWFEQNLAQQVDASPTIFWHQFESWEAFTRHAKRNESKLFSGTQRRQRNLEKEVGVVQFVLDDPHPDVLETCFRWKSEQLQRQGVPDPFTNPTHLNFLRALVARGILLVSSLRAGSYLLAIDLSMVHQGRFYSWISAYNAAYHQYSPGRLLFHQMLQESFQQQHTEFDLLWGGEDYKWHYATHVRLVADLGVRPLPRKLNHLVKTALGPFPQVSRSVKQIGSKMLRLTLV
jgi:CelD/BcsL family acetyltransferase involved in cellulose biosynthesis